MAALVVEETGKEKENRWARVELSPGRTSASIHPALGRPRQTRELAWTRLISSHPRGLGKKIGKCLFSTGMTPSKAVFMHFRLPFLLSATRVPR
jgi:hypothetical protein